MSYRASAVLAGGFVLLVGCSRKAPGPEACHAFALQAYGIADRSQLREPRVKAVVDDLTTKCLTTPFDRQLLSCVDRGGDVQRCLAAFTARYGGEAPAR